MLPTTHTSAERATPRHAGEVTVCRHRSHLRRRRAEQRAHRVEDAVSRLAQLERRLGDLLLEQLRELRAHVDNERLDAPRHAELDPAVDGQHDGVGGGGGAARRLRLRPLGGSVGRERAAEEHERVRRDGRAVAHVDGRCAHLFGVDEELGLELGLPGVDRRRVDRHADGLGRTRLPNLKLGRAAAAALAAAAATALTAAAATHRAHAATPIWHGAVGCVRVVLAPLLGGRPLLALVGGALVCLRRACGAHLGLVVLLLLALGAPPLARVLLRLLSTHLVVELGEIDLGLADGESGRARSLHLAVHDVGGGVLGREGVLDSAHLHLFGQVDVGRRAAPQVAR
mmetsp:Transcript_71616/g.215257  ORF Transcript_71616/g.215257 Transcript_71616/m.215257 type:complete len:342 (-) Transcript_71616:147-1172(-)